MDNFYSQNAHFFLLVNLSKQNNIARKVHNYRSKIMISNYAIPWSYSVFRSVCACVCTLQQTRRLINASQKIKITGLTEF